MRLSCALILAGLIGACDSPSPGLQGAVPTRLEMGGYRITVWRADDRVEAIRHGYAPRRDRQGLRATLADAMRRATGCTLRDGSIAGDSGVLRAKLDCAG